VKIESPGGGISVELADVLASVDDLDQVQRALIREQTIRQVMAETGESREIAAETLDAMISMDREAVRDLMEGDVTTLRAGLERLAEGWHQNGVPDGAEYELDTLLAYPWPG
jgi:CII-binding regulator of phage lambda lysogenization HflD